MSRLSESVLPVLIAVILLYGFFKKVSVFQVFLQGAATGIETIVRILPTLVGLITAVSMLQASGLMELLATAAQPLTRYLMLPAEVIPLALIHPISGGGATAVFTDLLSRYGSDSTIGRVASVLCGSDETTFYALTVYYGSVGVEKFRHTLFAALLADVSVVLISGVGVALFFNSF